LPRFCPLINGFNSNDLRAGSGLQFFFNRSTNKVSRRFECQGQKQTSESDHNISTAPVKSIWSIYPRGRIDCLKSKLRSINFNVPNLNYIL